MDVADFFILRSYKRKGLGHRPKASRANLIVSQLRAPAHNQPQPIRSLTSQKSSTHPHSSTWKQKSLFFRDSEIPDRIDSPVVDKEAKPEARL